MGMPIHLGGSIETPQWAPGMGRRADTPQQPQPEGNRHDDQKVTADARFTLTAAEVRTAHRCARVMVQFHDRAGKPVSAEISAHYERLDNEVRSLTRSRQGDDENDSDRRQLNVIGTARVAELIGWSKRTVHRRHADLGGWKVDGIGYLFREDKVIQYAGAKNGR